VARVTVVEADALAEIATERLTVLIAHTIAERGLAFVALTGGTTPRATYEAIADRSQPGQQRIDWSRVHLFWGDERHVPPDHPDSNFGMANHALVQHVPIPADHVHRIQGELSDPHQAAAEYARELPDGFDVMLLGLGDDCHIASIFPDSPLLEGWRAVKGRPAAIDANSRSRSDLCGPTVTVAATLAPKGWRITLTPPAILNSRAIVMLVAGAEKATAVAAAIEGPFDVTRCPAQLMREADDRVEWLLDTTAASRLDRS
jgi:6-phosphogluconolactonase